MKLSVCPSQTGLILVLTLFIDQGGEVVWWLVGAYYCEAVRVLTQSSLDVEEDRGLIDEMAAIDLCYLLRGRWLEAEKGAYGRHSTKVPGLSQCEQELGQPLESGRDERHPAGPAPFRARDSAFRGPVLYRWLFLNRVLIYCLLSNRRNKKHLVVAFRILQFDLCLVVQVQVQALTNPRSLLDASSTTNKT